ncbi:COG1832 Predicted CoA-binding protein [Candidatus Planktophila versatilis]|uniref:CoA-binding protein n=1 Tax=Candidatus Planktophila versatilis TaxID=1884905 RepID=UPI003BEED6D3
MPGHVTDNTQIRNLIKESRTIAIVGVSDKPERPSYGVAKYLLEHSHYTIFLVNPMLDTALGERVYHSLSEIPEHIDLVDVFRKPSDCMEVLEEAIAVGADAIWLQLGITSLEVLEAGAAAGMNVVMDRCLKVDYSNFL